LLGEVGLAVSTAMAAVIQVVALLVSFHRRHAALPWSDVRSSLAKTAALSALMSVSVALIMQLSPIPATTFALALQLLVATAAGMSVYAVGAIWLGMAELDQLLPWRPAVNVQRWFRQVV
jgi:peptidoglycan biosynthesis protein MviN/MurJ (putative lipid II flippase)